MKYTITVIPFPDDKDAIRDQIRIYIARVYDEELSKYILKRHVYSRQEGIREILDKIFDDISFYDEIPFDAIKYNLDRLPEYKWSRIQIYLEITTERVLVDIHTALIQDGRFDFSANKNEQLNSYEERVTFAITFILEILKSAYNQKGE